MDEATREAIYEAIQKSMPNRETSTELLSEMARNLGFVLDHLEGFRESYPDHWVAVHDNKVLATARTRQELHRGIRASGVPLGDTYIRFMSSVKTSPMLRAQD
jgi:hypothetical protein